MEPLTEHEAAQHLATSQRIRDTWLGALDELMENGSRINNMDVYTAMGMMALEISAINNQKPQRELDALIHEIYVIKSMLKDSPDLANALQERSEMYNKINSDNNLN